MRFIITHISILLLLITGNFQSILSMRPPARPAQAPARPAAHVAADIECPRCTFLNPSDALFCELCGQPLPQPSRRPAPAPVRQAGTAPLQQRSLQQRSLQQQRGASSRGSRGSRGSRVSSEEEEEEEEGKEEAGAQQAHRPIQRPIQRAQERQQPAGNVFLANDFFKDIVGMDEETFRKTYGWTKDSATEGHLSKVPAESYDAFDKWKKDWIAEFPRRKAIFEIGYTFDTVGQLDDDIQEQVQKSFLRKMRPLGKAHFSLLLHDPKNPVYTEITALQANPANRGALFQLASTFFGPLEGNMQNPASLLTDMLNGPVQGEWASISAAGATIFRKYFMPTWNSMQRRDKIANYPNYFYLLHTLRNKAPYILDREGRLTIDLKAIQNYRYSPEDISKVGIFTHRDVTVTSSCVADQELKRNARLESIPISANQQITQVLNSAYSLNKAYEKLRPGQQLSPAITNFARMILAAMYEGTLKSAYLNHNKVVYLTLLGGGAFLNDIAWIADIFENPTLQRFIKDAGLTIQMIYRPDKERDFLTRTADGDINFIQRMYQIADAINETNYASQLINSQLIQDYFDYITHHYGQRGTPVAAVPQRERGRRAVLPAREEETPAPHHRRSASRGASARARSKSRGRGALAPVMAPIVAPVAAPAHRRSASRGAPVAARSTSAAATTALRQIAAVPVPIVPQKYYKMLDRAQTGKEYDLGWLYSPTYDDWVLINCNKDKQPLFKSNREPRFYAVSPNTPSEPLPAGLYYWKSSAQVKIPQDLSTRDKPVIVKNHPTGKSGFHYSRNAQNYVNTKDKKKIWDPATFKALNGYTIEKEILDLIQ